MRAPLILLLALFLVAGCDERRDAKNLTSQERLAAIKAALKYEYPMPEDLSKAESLIKGFDKNGPELEEAQKLLKKAEAARARAIEAAADQKRKFAIANPVTSAKEREAYAEELEKALLRKHWDVFITVSGPENTTFTMKYVLLSRPTVFQLQESDFFENLKKRGFKRAVLTDGHRYTWNFDLAK